MIFGMLRTARKMSAYFVAVEHSSMEIFDVLLSDALFRANLLLLLYWIFPKMIT